MKLLSIYKTILSESVQPTEGVRAFYDRFVAKNQNPEFLNNSFKNPDFELRVVSEGGVKKSDFRGLPNKCETNTFDFIKQYAKAGSTRFYPVSGWVFLESTTFFEHFWVYDDMEDLFLEVTPVGDGIVAYGGVINKTINGDIAKADNFYDIEFLKGKHHTSLYSKHMDNKPEPRLNSYKKKTGTKDETIFNYINTSSSFIELKSYLQDKPEVTTVDDLRRESNKLDKALDSVKNSREYNLLYKIESQISRLLNNM